MEPPFSERQLPTSDTIAMQNHLLQEANSSPRHDSSGDLKVKLQKILEAAENSIASVKFSLEVAEEVISDTKTKLQKLESQMVDVRTAVVEIYSHRRSLGAAKCPASKRLKRALDEIDLSSQERTSDVLPADELEDICSDLSASDAEMVSQAAQGSKGVLSHQEFLTFLHLSRQVDDPVQLAKVSFTKETFPLYYQLKTFLFNLKNLNKSVQEAQGASDVDHTLDEKFHRLVEAFSSHLPEDQ